MSKYIKNYQKSSLLLRFMQLFVISHIFGSIKSQAILMIAKQTILDNNKNIFKLVP